MSGGSLNSIPSPPAGKTGWPWTKESKPISPLMRDGNPWPKISIVTPSYNQGKYLEETIRSVLLQNYPNLEYIIMDGGSTDDSVETIRRYEPWLTYWVSERDKGQADAIYRGFEKSSGEIMAWINSDDLYLPDALWTTAREFIHHAEAELLVGGYKWIRESGKDICKHYSFPQEFESLLCSGQLFGQMGCFWRREAFFGVGGFDRSLLFCFDYDLFLRLSRRRKPLGVDRFLAASRAHNLSKSSTIWHDTGIKEKEQLQQLHGIGKLSSGICDEIVQRETNRIKWCERKGLLRDIVQDPSYFVKSIGSRVRAALFKDITAGKKTV